MATTEFIAAIELGSSKIAGIAGRKNYDGSIQVLAYAQEDSSTFIRKGVVFNLDQTTQAIASILQKLNRELKATIAKVYVSIGGQSLRTVPNVVTRELGDETIISEDIINSICDENISVPLVQMEILEVAPQEYKVGNNWQANPVGLRGNLIEGHFLNIVARNSVRRNLEHCFKEAGIEVADVFLSPLMTAHSVLGDSERRSGVALVDIGADTTTVSIYKNNLLRYLNVIPLGGSSITRDLTTLNIDEEEAERLKQTYGNARYEEPTDSMLPLRLEDGRTIDRALFNDVVASRAEELAANVAALIRSSAYGDKLLAGLVLTGGGVNLKNLDALLREQAQVEKVRTAHQTRLTLHTDDMILTQDGRLNTLIGLLFRGDQNCCCPPATPSSEPLDLFENDPDLERQKEEARRRQEKEQQAKEKEQKQQAKEAKAEKMNKPKPKGPGWFDRTFGKFSESLFGNDEETMN